MSIKSSSVESEAMLGYETVMYVPSRFKNEDVIKSLQLISDHPLATVISTDQGEPFISHLPLIVETRGDELFLIGHLARANPHWRLLNSQVTYVIFHGPQCYITPKWYAENDVPTWNYAVVHIKGKATLIEDEDGLKDCLQKLSDHMEKQSKEPWEFWIPEDLSEPGMLSKAIVGFEISIESIQSKFKLSQNRSAEDRAGVMTGLKARGDDMSLAILDLMKSR